jgi:AcrR family transcriptional regulator
MPNEPQPVSRRERLRAQTFREIEDSSFAIIDAEGVHALSIAAVARSLAMSGPALYRYFASRDALVEHLITLSYEQLTAAMSAAAEGGRRTPRTRVRLMVGAYRDWALRHRRRYGMLFAERAADAPAAPAARTPLDRAMALLVDLLVAIQDGAPAEGGSGDRTLDGQLRGWARAQDRPDTTPRAATAAILIWSRVHGIVSLELTGVFDDGAIEAKRLIELEVDNAVGAMLRTGS